MHDFTFTMPAGIRYGIGMHEQLGTMLKDEMQFQKVIYPDWKTCRQIRDHRKVKCTLCQGHF